MLDQISRALPPMLWLTELKQTPVANEVVIDGRCTTLTGLSDFVGNLEASGYFKRSVEIVSSTTEAAADAAGRAGQVRDQGACSSSRSTPAAPAATAGTAPAAPVASQCNERRRHRQRLRTAQWTSVSPNSRGTRRSARSSRSRWRLRRLLLLLRDAARAEMAAREAQLEALRADIDKGAGDREEAAGVRAQVNDLEGRLDQSPGGAAGREGRRRSAAPHADGGGAVEPDDQELQAGAGRHQAAARRVADHPRARRHLSQPGDVLRPRRQVHPHRQHHRPGGQRAREAPGDATITATCVATTFVLLDKPRPAAGDNGVSRRKRRHDDDQTTARSSPSWRCRPRRGARARPAPAAPPAAGRRRRRRQPSTPTRSTGRRDPFVDPFEPGTGTQPPQRGDGAAGLIAQRNLGARRHARAAARCRDDPGPRQPDLHRPLRRQAGRRCRDRR